MMTNDIFDGTVFAVEDPIPLILCALVVGFFVGFLLDLFSVTEIFFGKNRIILFFSDLVSVLTGYLVLFACALHYNNGIIRWYDPFFAFVGFRTYRRLLSTVVLAVIGFVCSAVSKFVCAVIRTVAMPIRAALRKLYRIYGKVSSVCEKNRTERAFKTEEKRYTALAAQGFELVPRIREERKKRVREKGKNKQARGDSDITRDGISDNRLLQAANGTE